MQNLSEVIFLYGLAFIMPVAVARFSVRAEWRVIAIACLIWYGFLALAFGTFRGGDPVGWALLVAVIFSTVAVPMIAVFLKVWNWLGRSEAGVPAKESSVSLLQRFLLSLFSPAQFAAIVVLVTGYFLGTYWWEQRDQNARAELVGRFLSLPPGTRFASFQSSRSPAAAPSIAAIVRFTKSQFDSFVAQLDQAPPWQQAPPALRRRACRSGIASSHHMA